jgi:predicted enzyme related to lactoylglutathione lyase
MLTGASVTANIPAADIARARSFYADVLGLTPVAEFGEGGMLVYRTDSGTAFSVYQTEYAGQAGHTIAQFHVEDVVAEARALQEKGVTLETTRCRAWSGTTASPTWPEWARRPGSRTARATSSASTPASRRPEIRSTSVARAG